MPEPLSRRRVVQLAVGSVVPAVAGCLGTEEENTWYADQLPNGTRISFASAKLETEPQPNGFSIAPVILPTVSGTNQPASEALDIEISAVTDTDDPLVAYPLTRGAERLTRSSVSLAVAGLYPIIDTPKQFVSAPRRVLATDRTTVLTGEFDRQELGDQLTADALLTAQYERNGEISGFDQYTPVNSPEPVEAPPVIAVSRNTVVTARTVAQLDRAVAVVTGAQHSIVDKNESAAWLVEQAGDSDLVVGTIGTPPDKAAEPSEESAPTAAAGFQPTTTQNVIAAVDIDSETATTTARFALDADSLEGPTREIIGTRFGAEGRDRSSEFTSTRATVRASYDNDRIGITLSEEKDEGRERLSPPAARALVPEGALEFWYVPPLSRAVGTFWVETVADTEATALQVTSELTGSNGSEVRPREPPIGAGIKLAAPVNLDGDTVTILAVNDEDTIGTVTSKRVPTDELTGQEASRAVPRNRLSVRYEPPDTGPMGTLSVETQRRVWADTLVVRPIEDSWSDRVGSLDDDTQIAPGRRLEIPVDTDGAGAVVFATVDGATGEVARWQGPE